MMVKLEKIVQYAPICQPPCGENRVCNVNPGYCDSSPGFTGPSCDDGRKPKSSSIHIGRVYQA